MQNNQYNRKRRELNLGLFAVKEKIRLTSMHQKRKVVCYVMPFDFFPGFHKMKEKATEDGIAPNQVIARSELEVHPHIYTE